MLECADRAEQHWLTGNAGARERAEAIRLRGLGYSLTGDHAAASEAFRQTVEVDRTLNAESEDVAIDLNALAMAEQAAGDLDAAERDYREALRIAIAVGASETTATTTGNLAGLALLREDWDNTRVLALQALALDEALGRQDMIAADCRRLGVALFRKGERAAAIVQLQRAVAVYDSLGMPAVKDARRTLAKIESEDTADKAH